MISGIQIHEMKFWYFDKPQDNLKNLKIDSRRPQDFIHSLLIMGPFDYGEWLHDHSE